MSNSKPNLVFVFADQWRYQAAGFTGDPNLQSHTPHLDALAAESLQFTCAISGTPVCSPARASLMTGQLPLTHGVFLNDAPVGSDATCLGTALKRGGFDTAYIGKWHIDGRGRSAYIPPERRGGFDFWRVLECTHDYFNSPYYADDDPTLRTWPGYDAEAQTREAQRYIQQHARNDNPFALVLSWGPPHNPYQEVPREFLERFDPQRLELRPNVPPEKEAETRTDLAGYYAHIAALDTYLGDLRKTLRDTGIADRTLLVVWSDHGDMLGSQGQRRKQRPWDESVHVPLLMHCPALFGKGGRVVDTPIDTCDLLPTLLELCGCEIPETVEGLSYAAHLRGEAGPPRDAVVIACYHPFGEWIRTVGGREYRGLRTPRHTYVETRDGPWLLYDNEADPYQLRNLVDDPAARDVRRQLADRLHALLEERGDRFEPGDVYVERWGYTVDANGTIPIT